MNTKTNNKATSGNEELKILQKSAKISSKKALRASKAMGLTVKMISNNEIIEKSPDGKSKIIRKVKAAPVNRKGLKKGTILCKK